MDRVNITLMDRVPDSRVVDCTIHLPTLTRGVNITLLDSVGTWILGAVAWTTLESGTMSVIFTPLVSVGGGWCSPLHHPPTLTRGVNITLMDRVPDSRVVQGTAPWMVQLLGLP